MTDNEIIKALECCTDTLSCPTDCPLFEDDRDCLLVLNKPTLDLINRQKAEIESLRNDLAKEFTCFVGSPHKVESCPFFDELEKERAEAVKEFAEKVKDEISNAIISNGRVIEEREKKYRANRYEDDLCIMCDSKIMALGGIKWFINDLVKELVGESDV